MQESQRPGVGLSSTVLPNQENVGLAELEWGTRWGDSLLGAIGTPFHRNRASLRSLPTTYVKRELPRPENIPAELLMMGESVQYSRVQQGLCMGDQRVAVGLPPGASVSPWSPEGRAGGHGGGHHGG